jgi:transcriptional regulator CtsR
MKREFLLNLIDKYNLANNNRQESECYKRYYLYYLLSRTGMGCSSIGRAFGKDHASVIYGIKQHKKWYKLKDQRYMDTIKQLMDELLMFECEMQYIPVTIKKRGVNYDITFTLEIDKDMAQSFEGQTTLNEIVAKFIEINTLSKI